MEDIQLFHIYRLDVPVNDQHQRQSNHGFGGGQSHHKNGESLSPHLVRMQEMIKSDEIDVGGVKHEFNRHQNPQDIAPGKHAVDADSKEDGGKHQEMMQGKPHPTTCLWPVGPTVL